MSNTWTINSNNTVSLNGTVIPNVITYELLYKHDLANSLTEVQVVVQVPDAVSLGILENLVSVLPGDPSLSSIHVTVPSIFYRSAVGDTVNTQALSLVQGQVSPVKEGV